MGVDRSIGAVGMAALKALGDKRVAADPAAAMEVAMDAMRAVVRSRSTRRQDR